MSFEDIICGLILAPYRLGYGIGMIFSVLLARPQTMFEEGVQHIVTFILSMIGLFFFAIFAIIATCIMIGVKEQREKAKKRKERIIPDKYKTIPELKRALAKAGVESWNLLLGIDWTRSNESNGAVSFGGRSLHRLHVYEHDLNPYQQAIQACTGYFDEYDDDRRIPTFIFGHLNSEGKCMQIGDPAGCYTFNAIMEAYRDTVGTIGLGGPTDFSHLIYKAIEIIEQKGGIHHILIIMCDGQVTEREATTQAIRTACDYPLSIVIIGIGDGPWDDMEMYDDCGCDQEWDNVQFVQYDPATMTGEDLVLHAFQEIPDQYTEIKKRKNKKGGKRRKRRGGA